MNNMRLLLILILITASLFAVFAPMAFAHVPLTGGENEEIATAAYVSNPTKSWVIYAELHQGEEAQYYQLDMFEDQRLRLSLFTPERSQFRPGLVIMAPPSGSDEHEQEHEHEHEVPAFVETPNDAIVTLLEGRGDGATYEPFGPGSSFFLVDVDMEVPATGTYYVAVYEPNIGGRYGLAVGYVESFTLDEWVRVPIDMIGVHQWEGQSLGFILAPLLAILVIGLGSLIWRRTKDADTPKSLFGWIGSFAGLLYIGSGAITLTQMFIALTRAPLVPSIAVTIIFALIPILLGVGALRVALGSERKMSIRTRAYIIIIGVLALFAWAGLLVGPILAIVAGVLPKSLQAGHSERQ